MHCSIYNGRYNFNQMTICNSNLNSNKFASMKNDLSISQMERIDIQHSFWTLHPFTELNIYLISARYMHYSLYFIINLFTHGWLHKHSVTMESIRRYTLSHLITTFIEFLDIFQILLLLSLLLLHMLLLLLLLLLSSDIMICTFHQNENQGKGSTSEIRSA